jgi:NAD(P)-dependent dehydrogenase (short-subunit alcohol dehydrogenase family)
MPGGALEGKVAAVTGAGSGLGRAAAVAFAEAGADVVVNDVDGAGLPDTAAAVEKAGGKALAHVGDVSDMGAVKELVAGAVEELGGLDVMHANAAIDITRTLEEISEEEMDATLDVNLKGPLLCAQQAIPAIRNRGGGSIVFVSSVQGYQGLPGSVTYAGAKAALIAAARTLSVEVGGDGIRVNAIVPGTIDTPMLNRHVELMSAADRDDFIARVQAANSLGRVGRPEEIAAAAVFLASESSSYVTGSALTVDGGFLAVKEL